MEDIEAIRDLQVRNATESDKNNQAYYAQIFRPDIHIRVIHGGKVTTEFHNVQDLISNYHSFSVRTKQSFHINGQHAIDFQDSTHATGIAYSIANVVMNNNGQDVAISNNIRYYDKYVKVDGRWWIAERDQTFVYTTFPNLQPGK